jgi:NAD(P)-dependent dehydrogenase (short-subunit alcohol dehydrogenase family)
MLATYTGAKAFLERWSQALGEETKEFGVDVRLVLPYFVVSNMSKIRRPSMLIPTAPTFVRATLASIGQARGAGGRPYTSTPYYGHALFDWAMSTFGLGGQFAMSKGLGEWQYPPGIHAVARSLSFPVSTLVPRMTAMHKDIRRRALAKKARLAKEQ